MTIFDGQFFNGRAYQARFDELAKMSVDVHGEATLVRSLQPGSALDAGCGTGRVAIELSRHGIDVVGVDLDASMITEARRLEPELEWLVADVATMSLGRLFDVVILAGNVPLFCASTARTALVLTSASHLAPGGTLVAGFQLKNNYPLSDYDLACEKAGLVLQQRWSTWDGQPFSSTSDYAVSVHRAELAS